VTTSLAVVLARGLGTRMRREVAEAGLTADQAAIAARGVKAMIPVGRPFLDYLLSSLADAGISRVCLVIGPEHELIRARYQREVRLTRLAVSFAIQPEPRGTADAVLAARDQVGDAPFLVVNGDNLYPTRALEALVALGGPGLIGYRRDALVSGSNIEPERIARFALIWTDADGYLRRIVEKPPPDQLTADALVSMNSWRFGPAIFEACRAIGPSVRGELELQDAVQLAIDRLGERFRVVPFAGPVLDLSQRTDVAAVADRVKSIEARL